MLCFGGEDWWYHNRAHIDMQLMRRFAESGTVLYVNSVMMRKVNIGEGRMFFKRIARKLASMRRGLVEVEARFFVYSPLTFPVHHMPLARGLNQVGLRLQAQRAMKRLGLQRPVIWVACPAASPAALALDREALVYQRTDRYEEYPGVDRAVIAGFDRELKCKADVTFFVNRTLYEEEAASCRRACLIDHGVDFDAFAGAYEDPRMPEDIASLPRPVVGFFGGIDDHTSDMVLSAEVAKMCPEYTFVFVGGASADLSPFAGLANVRFLGRKPYEEIPHYGKCFDVAIMPWQRNRWIEACNPIKLKEYLALGKPVVSTPFSELDRYKGLVYVADSAASFADAIRRAIREDDQARRKARQEAVMHDTWEAKAMEALSELSRVCTGVSEEGPRAEP